MLRPPSLSNILLRFGSLDFWLIILICHRYSNVFLWFLVGFHGFQGIFKLLSLPHFHFLPFAMINRKMLLVNNWQFCSGSPDASMSTVLLPPYFHFLSLTTKKSILIVSIFRLSWCFNVNSALAFSIILLAIVYKDKENQCWLSQVQAPRMLQCQRCSGRRLSSFKRTPSGNCRIFTVRRKNWWK